MKTKETAKTGIVIDGRRYCVALYAGDTPDADKLLAYSTNDEMVASVATTIVCRVKEQRAEREQIRREIAEGCTVRPPAEPQPQPMQSVAFYAWPFPRPDKEVLRINDSAFVTECSRRAVEFIELEREQNAVGVLVDSLLPSLAEVSAS